MVPKWHGTVLSYYGTNEHIRPIKFPAYAHARYIPISPGLYGVCFISLIVLSWTLLVVVVSRMKWIRLETSGSSCCVLLFPLLVLGDVVVVSSVSSAAEVGWGEWNNVVVVGDAGVLLLLVTYGCFFTVCAYVGRRGVADCMMDGGVELFSEFLFSEESSTDAIQKLSSRLVFFWSFSGAFLKNSFNSSCCWLDSWAIIGLNCTLISTGKIIAFILINLDDYLTRKNVYWHTCFYHHYSKQNFKSSAKKNTPSSAVDRRWPLQWYWTLTTKIGC